ncbi:MAG: DNA topoisomerase (ATP-hydrolyzing) subunit A [Candidatus Izemoplasmatales bacterium]|nr:DNA topoisomerase (ATP-hydrolyzing) subunit A [Candidatus Izemoplasmatales bacterium]
METIEKQNIVEQYKRHMAIYSIEVSRRRMVVDWRDGLLLSQRRVLFAMLEDHCDKKFIKTQKVIGTTMGDYHPHGDASLNGTITNMTNWWSFKEPLITNKSNFGSMQGDGPAAPRYTEIKLSEYSMECILSEMMDNRSVVDWVPTYNNTGMEPEYLPARIPNLLINGTFNIAVGFVTGVPKHSINDVIDATINLINNPAAPVVLIPDQCMACDIIESNWKAISNKGKGKFRIRARIDIETYNDLYQLVIKSTPDMVYFDKGKAENGGEKYKIIEMVKSGKIPQIMDIVDHSKENDMRIIIKLRKGSDPNYVKEILYKHTQLETTFGINFEVLNGIELIKMSYKGYLEAFIAQRLDTKFRSYAIKLQNTRTKYHEKDAYVKVLESGEIDNIIQMIRKRKTIDDNDLMEYLIKKLNITNIQAKFIINVNLKNLSEAYLDKYKREYQELKLIEADCLKKITDESLLKKEIVDELLYFKQKYGKPRKCRIIKQSEANGIPEGRFKVIITEGNYVKKINENDPANTYRGDAPKHVLKVDNTESILLFSDKGRVFNLPVHKIPVTDNNSIGVDIRILVKGLTSDIVKIIYTPELIQFTKTKKHKFFLTVVTKGNYIKKMDLEDFMNIAQSGLLYTKLNGEDIVKEVQIVPYDADIIIYSDRKALRIGMDNVPHLKRSTLGNQAMNSKEPIDGFTQLSNTVAPYIVAITDSGKINKIPAEALPKSERNKAGCNVIKLGRGDKIFAVHVLHDNHIIKVKCAKDVQQIKVSDIPIGSSISNGVKMINTKTNAIVRDEIMEG